MVSATYVPSLDVLEQQTTREEFINFSATSQLLLLFFHKVKIDIPRLEGTTPSLLKYTSNFLCIEHKECYREVKFTIFIQLQWRNPDATASSFHDI